MGWRGKRPSNFDGLFVGLERTLLESKAYRDLTPSAAKVYTHMAMQNRINNHNGAKDFAFTYADASRRGFARSTFSRAITDLVAKGFIAPKAHGGLRGFCLIENRFALTNRWKDYGKEGFEPAPRYDEDKIGGCGRV